MKPEDINRVIAEHCGVNANYHEDLNAMHEAEKLLLIEEESKFGEQIRKMTKNIGPRGGHFTPNGFGCFAMAHATAAQRAEAFLKAIDKWNDQ